MEEDILDYEEQPSPVKVDERIRYVGFIRAFVTFNFLISFLQYFQNIFFNIMHSNRNDDSFMILLLCIPLGLVLYYKTTQIFGSCH